MGDARPRRARPRVGLALVVAAALAGCGGTSAPEAGADDVDAGTDEPASAASPSAPPVDLESFAVVDNATWAGIHASPQASAGQRVVVYAYVTRTFAAMGDTVQASVSTAHPANGLEGTLAVLRGDPEVLGLVETGSVLRVHAEVVGPYAGQTGRAERIPELAVADAEDVGPYDLAADVTVGTAERTNGRLQVPVAVRNSSDLAMVYRVDLVATSADGATELSRSRVDLLLEPGARGEAGAALDPAGPGAVVAVEEVTRFAPAPPQ